jgi:hypothetical protein
MSKKVVYYIEKNVYDSYVSKLDKLAKEFEEKNIKTSRVSRIRGSLFINKKIDILIKDKIPTDIIFNGEKLGICLKPNELKDKEHMTFFRNYDEEVDDIYTNYKLKVCEINDGYLKGILWEAYDLHGNLIKDLTNYDDWK